MGKAGKHVPYKMPPLHLQRQPRQRDVTYLPGQRVIYKAPPEGSGPKRGGLAPTPRETPREATATEPLTLTAPYRLPPPQSPQRARSSRHDVCETRAEPIRHTTRPIHDNESNANALRAAVGRVACEHVTSAEHPDRENDQTAHASRPTETTQVNNREASVATDAPVPLQKHHST